MLKIPDKHGRKLERPTCGPVRTRTDSGTGPDWSRTEQGSRAGMETCHNHCWYRTQTRQSCCRADQNSQISLWRVTWRLLSDQNQNHKTIKHISLRIFNELRSKKWVFQSLLVLYLMICSLFTRTAGWITLLHVISNCNVTWLLPVTFGLPQYQTYTHKNERKVKLTTC